MLGVRTEVPAFSLSQCQLDMPNDGILDSIFNAEIILMSVEDTVFFCLVDRR